MAGRVKFSWQDPLDLNGLLSEEERMIRDTAHQYCLATAYLLGVLEGAFVQRLVCR